MGPTLLPYQPWLHHQNCLSSALADRGMEIRVAPGQLPPSSTSKEDYVTKVLPATPIRFQGGSNRHHSSQTATRVNQRQLISMSASYNSNLEGTSPSRPLLGSKAYSTPQPLNPPMSKSTQKILRLTGYDHSLDRTLTQTAADSTTSSKSSGSKYSQPELDRTPSNSSSHRASGSSRPHLEHRGAYPSQASAWSHSDDGESLRASETPSINSRPGQRNSKFLEKANTNTDNITALDEILFQEILRSEQGFENDIGSKYRHNIADVNLIPRPLVLRNKPRPFAVEVSKKPSFLASAQDSFSWGVDEITSPSKIKHLNTPVTGAFTSTPTTYPSTQMPSPPLPKCKRFEAGSSPSEPSGTKLSTRLSGAVKQLSHGRLHIKRNVIKTTARTPDGPDTPMPTKSSGFMNLSPTETFQRGNKHFHDAVTKARMKANIKTSKERRRESLKKKIVVVGITDQSPDGRVSEWL